MTSHLFALAASSVKCNAQRAQALGRIAYYLFRLIYHIWGITGVLKVAGTGIFVYGSGRMAYLISRPIEQYNGCIKLINGKWHIYPGRTVCP